MALEPSCPRCPTSLVAVGSAWRCPDHGAVDPLWRPAAGADYDSFADFLAISSPMPSLMPWPLSPGWTVTDYGCVAPPGGAARATSISCTGTSDLDGVVELTVVSEEPGVGLGSRCAGVNRTDPGSDVGDGPPLAKVRIDGHPISLWSVLTSDSDSTFDRSVFAGEAHGRWLWMVLRPASAALLLKDEWILCDIGELGPELIDLPFGGGPPTW